MIRYTLVCERGHDFESWFKGSDAFDAQAKRGLVTCPACGSPRVEKSIMAPQVARKDRQARTPPVPAAPQPAAVLPPEAVELRAKIKELREALTKNATDVGEKLPEVARQMHYGETDEKPIYGAATLEDARELMEEGIRLLPLPLAPDEQN